MELPKNLLRSVALGIGLGLTTTGCSILEIDNDPNFCTEECSPECDGETCENAGGDHAHVPLPAYPCPACGMG